MTIWLTVLFSVTIMPNGATIPVYVIVQAVVVAAVVVGGVLSRCGDPGCRRLRPHRIRRHPAGATTLQNFPPRATRSMAAPPPELRVAAPIARTLIART